MPISKNHYLRDKDPFLRYGHIYIRTDPIRLPCSLASVGKKLVSSDISHIAFASVLLGENPSEEVDDYDNYYYYE